MIVAVQNSMRYVLMIQDNFHFSDKLNSNNGLEMSLLHSTQEIIGFAKCSKIVAITSAKRTKTEQIQKIESDAILQLAKGFS